jgi:hypothetical protein
MRAESGVPVEPLRDARTRVDACTHEPRYAIWYDGVNNPVTETLYRGRGIKEKELCRLPAACIGSDRRSSTAT